MKRERNWSKELAPVAEIVREAGTLARSIREAGIERTEKSHQDFVTAADTRVEEFVRTAIAERYPGDSVFGEEGTDTFGELGAISNVGQSDAVWILDPVDGTSNFAAGLDTWCVSLGVVVEGETQIGVLYAPDRDELYTAARGGGAHLNGVPLHVSRDVPKTHSLIMTGRGAVLSIEEYVASIQRMLAAGFEYRRYGSGALGIAMVATGTIQGYIETGMWPWDVTAALLIVAEAGGYTTPYLQAPPKRQPGPPLVACQPGLENELLAVLTGQNSPEDSPGRP